MSEHVCPSCGSEVKADRIVECGSVFIDLVAAVVRERETGRLVHVSGREWQIIEYMAQRRGRVVGYEELLRAVWGPEMGPRDRPILTSRMSRMKTLGLPFISFTGRGYGLFPEDA